MIIPSSYSPPITEAPLVDWTQVRAQIIPCVVLKILCGRVECVALDLFTALFLRKEVRLRLSRSMISLPSWRCPLTLFNSGSTNGGREGDTKCAINSKPKPHVFDWRTRGYLFSVSRDVTAAVLMCRAITKKVFWQFDSIIIQNLRDI